MVVASGKPLRHLDYFTGKHFVLQTAGIRLESWFLNPQMWWKHSSDIPLGTSDLELDEEGRLVAYNIRFHRMKVPVNGWGGIGEFDTGIIADLAESGVLRASSVQVNFTADDIARVFETKDHVIVPSSELIEWSYVTAPADREAVMLKLDGFGLDSSLARLILGEQARENSAPVIVSPAPQTENNMDPTEQVPQVPEEFELPEEAVQAIAMEAAALLSSSTEFTSSLINAVVSSPELAAAMQSALAAAAPVAPPSAPVAPPEAQAPRQYRLTVPPRQTIPEPSLTPAPAAAPTLPQTNSQQPNGQPLARMNRPTVKSQLLVSMVQPRS